MNLKIFYLIVILLPVFVVSSSFAQYQMVLKNDTMVANNQYDFDIFIKSQSGVINLTAYQIILTINDSIAQGGTLTFSYIKNSSQLSNIPDVNIGIIEDSTIQNLAVGSNQGSDTISTEYVRIGRFEISGPNPFGNYKANVNWDFAGFNKSIININDTDKTAISNHLNLLKNPLYIITGITNKKPVPSKFELLQNYPNPFNPNTEIKYNLPEASRVTLNVYNIIGQQVASLVNGNVEAGFHSVIFNGSDLPSGTYLYRLQIYNFVQTKKMILLK